MKYNRFLLCLIFITPAYVYALDGGVNSLRQTGKAFAEVARTVSPSVVFIQVESSLSEPKTPLLPTPFGGEWPFGDDLFKRFFGDQLPGLPRSPAPRQRRHSVGQGSGFVFMSKGGLLSNKTYILTNNHVVEHAEKIQVKFQNGHEFDAKITGTDPKSDVAVIEIKAGELPALPLGNSAELEVGEWVVAIGNPFGLSHTLTVGVVSAKGRTGIGISDYEDFIQTDAAINPGNSGGPLVNLDGQAIGINTAIFSRSGGYMGVGFAIPINLVKSIAQQLVDHGEVTRGYIGVVIQALTPELAKSFNIEQSQGILIAEVTEDSPAEKAGLQQGDVIIAYRNEKVTNVGDLRNRIALTEPGKRESLSILRNGKHKILNITIGKLSKDKLTTLSSTQSSDELGLTVQTMTSQLAEQFGIKEDKGVVVTKVEFGSIAASAGIHLGSLILQVDRQPINNVEDFQRAVKKSRADKQILLLVRDGNNQRYIVLSW